MRISPRFILLLILIFSLLIRIPRLDYPLSNGFRWGDGTRDFLVANHILKYKETPQVGPYNLLFDWGIKNSPVYFYILALFLFPFNHPVALSFLNIFLQIIVLVLIYLIVKKMFDVKTALVAVFLYSFNPEIITQSDYIWQPYLMQPILLLSLYFLTKAFSKREYGFFTASLITISLAISIHNSTLSWLPVFLLLGTFFFRENLPKYLTWSVLTVLVSFLVFHLPLFFFYKDHQSFGSITHQILIFDTGQYFENLSSNIVQILNMYNINIFIFLVFGILSFVYVLQSKNKLVNKWLLITFLLFFLPIVFASFFNKIRLHYLITSSTLFIFWISALVNLATRNLSKILLLAILFTIFSNNLEFLNFNKHPLENLRYIENISDKIVSELREVKQKNNFKNFDFFQVRVYEVEGSAFNYPVLDTLLLVPLEDKLNQKLTKLSDESPYNHTQINRMDYLIVSCNFYNQAKNLKCKDEFVKNYKNYSLVKSIYQDDRTDVYLAKQWGRS